MDELIEKEVAEAVARWISQIDLQKVAALASGLRDGQKCEIHEPVRGSFNICFRVDFCALNTLPEAQWMVRFPILPRLAFPEEKLKAEIATMMCVLEKTKILIPKIISYDLSGNNITGLPHLIMEYVSGTTLQAEDLPWDAESPYYGQLALIYKELRGLEFPHIGALTLRDGSWAFLQNRPLSIDMNEQAMGKLDPDSIISEDQVFKTAVDFYKARIALSKNALRSRDAYEDETYARRTLFAFSRFLDIVAEWASLDQNHGPFVLTHGDLLISNIIVSDDGRFVVIDWEWSHTVPLDLLQPPYWLGGNSLAYLDSFYASTRLLVSTISLRSAARELRIQKDVSDIWRKNIGSLRGFCIAHGLLRVNHIPRLFWYYMRKETDSEEAVNDYVLGSPECQKTLSDMKEAYQGFQNLKDLPQRKNEGALAREVLAKLSYTALGLVAAVLFSLTYAESSPGGGLTLSR